MLNKLFAFALMMLASAIVYSADTIDREYQAVDAAGRYLIEKIPGCTKYKVINLVKGYTVGTAITKYNDYQTVTVTGYSFRVACVEYGVNPPTGKVWDVTFDAPITRANGTPLDPSQILLYEVWVDDALHGVTKGLVYRVEFDDNLEHKVKLKTVDIYNLKSVFSTEIALK